MHSGDVCYDVPSLVRGDDDKLSHMPRKPTATSKSKDATANRPGKSGVSKVSHTLTVELARRLEEFAFYQRFSESAVIEHSLALFFRLSDDDDHLGEILRREGAGRRRKVSPD